MKEFTGTSVVWPDDTMNRRNWLFDRWTWALTYSGIVLIPVALLLVKAFALLGWLPALMALGPILAGLWLFATNQLGAKGKSPREATAYRQASIAWLVQSAIVAAVIGFGAFLVILLGSGSWSSYDFLKSGWFVLIYLLFGLTPVICYAAAIQRLLAKRSLGWTMGLGVASLLAPWFWSGFAVYAAYHTL